MLRCWRYARMWLCSAAGRGHHRTVTCSLKLSARCESMWRDADRLLLSSHMGRWWRWYLHATFHNRGMMSLKWTIAINTSSAGATKRGTETCVEARPLHQHFIIHPPLPIAYCCICNCLFGAHKGLQNSVRHNSEHLEDTSGDGPVSIPVLTLLTVLPAADVHWLYK